MSISVVIPLFNKAPYIEAALRSVLAQSRPADQIIVVDDGSTDEGPSLVQAFAGVTLVRQANSGVSVARNTGVSNAVGDLVAFLDADDEWLPEHLSLIEKAAAEHPHASVVCAGYECFADAGVVSRHMARPGIVPSFYREWTRNSFTFTSAIAVRRSALQQLEVMFPAGERLGEDQDVWFRLAEAAPVAHVGVASARYRVDAANNSSGGKAVVDLLPCYARLADRLKRGVIPAHEVAGARRLVGSHFINVARARAQAGDKSGARTLLWTRAATGNPIYWIRSLLAVG